MQKSINRRDFIKRAGTAGVGLSLASYLSPLARGQNASAPSINTIGANDKIRVAVIGTNGRGIAHVECLTGGLPNVEITYICDVDDRAIAKGIKATLKRQQSEPKGMKDFRKVLADKSVDAITIATPDHWHAPMAIMGLAAGKHVYVEKPCSHNPREGELLIEAVKKYQRVCQMGNQRRSFPTMHEAMEQLHGGVIGKLVFARAWYTNKRGPIGHGKPAPVPEWLDYDLWQGPAPRKAFVDNLIHYNWHWHWHWGTGEALNNGTHEVDVCRWALGVDWPSRVTSNGGRYFYQDDWETPDTQVIAWDYPDGKSISWEGRSCNGYPVEGFDRGAIVYGTSGTALLENANYTIYDSKRKVIKSAKADVKADPTDTVSASGIELDQLHVKNFLDCIRSGQTPNSPITEGHKSVAMLHLGNIAWRVGRELNCDTTNGHIQKDSHAAALWHRSYEPGWEPKV
jgi:predicted dehydrogenase